MPILIDYSQFCIAAVFASMEQGFSKKDISDINIIRHVLLNSIKSNRKKFTHIYGELVICVDSTNTWRNDVFPYYKIRRKNAKKVSDIDWNKLFSVMSEIREELENVFPYKVVKVDKCEADDIIGVLSKYYSEEKNESVLILSRDKDFKQLQKYSKVSQYDQRDKKFLDVDDPELFLKTMLLTGDSDDDIPNVLSPDDVFAIGGRQKPMTQKRKDNILAGIYEDKDIITRIERNRQLIDLECVPKELQKDILTEYENKKVNGRSSIYKFLIEKNMRYLLEEIGDF